MPRASGGGTHGYRPPGNDELNPKKRNKALKARKRLVVMRVLRAGPVGEAMEEEVEAGPVGEAMEEEQAGPADDDEEEDEGGEADGSSKAEKKAAKRSLDRKFASEVHSLLTGPRSGHAPPGLSGDLAQELAAVWNVSALDYLYDIERAPSEPRNQKLLLQYKNGCLPPPLLWRKDPLLANQPEGLLLDPVYTGKSMAACLNHVRASREDQSTLFVHTGGTPGLFGYGKELNLAD